MSWHSQINVFVTPEWVTERGVTKRLADFIQNAYDKIYEIPILGVVLSPGVYTALIPSFSLCSAIKYRDKRKKKAKPNIG